MRYRNVLGAICIAALVAVPAFAQQQASSVASIDPFVGTWQTQVKYNGETTVSIWKITPDGTCTHTGRGGATPTPVVRCAVGADGTLAYQTTSTNNQVMRVKLTNKHGRISGTAVVADRHHLELLNFVRQ